MKPSKKRRARTAIRLRCGTPHCKWSVTSPDLSEVHVEYCYARFREHCIDRHNLDEDDTERYFFFNFNLAHTDTA
jgi:hypothetical protein